MKSKSIYEEFRSNSYLVLEYYTYSGAIYSGSRKTRNTKTIFSKSFFKQTHLIER